MKPASSVLFAIALVVGLRGDGFAAPTSCDGIKQLKLPDTTITSAENVPALTRRVAMTGNRASPTSVPLLGPL